MKRQLLLFALLLAGLTNVHADNGTLSIANVRNAVPGYTGSFDIVLSNSDLTYCAFQFDLTLPDGLTYSSYVDGAMINGHEIQTSNHEGNMTRFTAHANPTADFTSANGTLLTIYFTVGGETATGDKTATLSEVTFSYNSTSYHPTAGDNTITVGSAITLKETDTTDPVAIASVDVTVQRTIKADVWNTIVLPFPMTNAELKSAFGDDVQLGSFNGYTDTDGNISVEFTSSETLAAHTPYIIKVSSAVESFTVNSATITVAGNSLTVNKGTTNKPKAMIGSYVPTNVPSNNLFITNNQFKYSQGNSTIKGFRAYFSFTDFDYEAAARSLSIDYFDMSTGVHDVNRVAVDDDRSFDLQGRPMKESQKGVRIVNGKKIMNK